MSLASRDREFSGGKEMVYVPGNAQPLAVYSLGQLQSYSLPATCRWELTAVVAAVGMGAESAAELEGAMPAESGADMPAALVAESVVDRACAGWASAAATPATALSAD